MSIENDEMLMLWQKLCRNRETLYEKAKEFHALDYIRQLMWEVHEEYEKGERPKRL